MGRRTAPARFRELGEELRRIRAKAKLTGQEMAHRTGWGTTKVSRVESGHMKLSEVDLIHYLGACRVFPPEANALLALCQDAHRYSDYWIESGDGNLSESFKALIYHEGTCGSATTYEPQVIPGLLQTENYARATIDHFNRGRHVEQSLRRRLARQQILHRSIPPRFDFFIDEDALRREVDGPATMHEQLLTLAIMSGLPTVVIRVLPRSGGISAAFGSAFKMLRFADHHPLVYLDSYVGGVFLENQHFVASYRQLVPDIADAALNEHESREFLADLASEYDRESDGAAAGEDDGCRRVTA